MMNRRAVLGMAGAAAVGRGMDAGAQQATPAASPTVAIDSVAFVRDFVDQVLSRRDVKALPRFVAEDYSPSIAVPGFAPGRDALAQRLIDGWVQMDNNLGTPNKTTFQQGFASADGGQVSYVLILTGPIRRQLEVAVATLREGKIVGIIGGTARL